MVWCPKYRRRVIGGRMEARLKGIIAEVIEEKGEWLVELQTMPDHVHLLVEVDPQFEVHRLVKAIKGRSSRVLREEFSWLRSRLPSLWTVRTSSQRWCTAVGDQALRRDAEGSLSVDGPAVSGGVHQRAGAVRAADRRCVPGGVETPGAAPCVPPG